MGDWEYRLKVKDGGDGGSECWSDCPQKRTRLEFCKGSHHVLPKWSRNAHLQQKHFFWGAQRARAMPTLHLCLFLVTIIIAITVVNADRSYDVLYVTSKEDDPR